MEEINQKILATERWLKSPRIGSSNSKNMAYENKERKIYQQVG